MEFTTPVQIPNFDFSIKYTDELFFIGSCFSNEIAQKFSHYGYQVMSNPLGTVYNTSAIANQIAAISQNQFDSKWIVKQNDDFLSLLHNTSFRNTSKEELSQQILQVNQNAFEAIINASYVFITLGSSWVYESKELQEVVANCQKLPQDAFIPRLQSIEEIVSEIQNIYETILSVNSRVKIIWTVSPVRYTSYGLHNNQISKAHLISALHQMSSIQEKYYYFPSYEIVLDELRDYRFFTEDYVHVSPLGVDYVWQKVKACFIPAKDEQIHSKVEKFRKFENHIVKGNEIVRQQHQEEIAKQKEQLIQQYQVKL